MAHHISKTRFAHTVILIAATYTSSALAENETIVIDDSTDLASELVNREGKTTLLTDTVPTAKVSDDEIREALQRKAVANTQQTYDLKTLQSDPLLFTKFLNTAIAAQDMQTVERLLPYYKQLDIKDPMLINFADALVYRSNQQNKQAIAIYKAMLLDNPDFHPVRLNMAQALYADKQYISAKNQLLKLQAAGLPAPIQAQVQGLITAIDRQEDWAFDASASYLQDNNLNDVPSSKMQSALFGSTLEPESGRGLQVSLSANKRKNLPENFYANFGANASLKAYTGDASDYNDYLLTTSIGVGYDDAKNEVSVTPFVSKRIYADNPYSWNKGITVKGSRWLQPKLKLTATGILSNETFDDDNNKKRETDGRFVGLNGLYLNSAAQYFYGGIGHYRNDVPQAAVISYDRNAIDLGWGREWTKGVSTLATVGYGVKTYDDVSDIYGKDSIYYTNTGGTYGVDREDKTTSLGLQVWKRDLTWLGLTPRLVLDYDKTSSNYKYYDDRDDKSATVMLSKTF